MKTINFKLNVPKELTFINLCTGLVHHASQFTSDITIEIEGSNLHNKVDLKSVLGVTSLVYANGKQVTIEISGDDEEDAYLVVGKYVERLAE